ncbi:MAG: hypothetical protein ACYDCK_05560 [Thermoplasmatota archaeon]
MRSPIVVLIAASVVATLALTPTASAREASAFYNPSGQGLAFRTFVGETTVTLVAHDLVASRIAVFVCQDVDQDGSCLQSNELHREYCTGPEPHTFNITGGVPLVVYAQPQATLLDLCGYVPSTVGSVTVDFA